MLRGNSWFCTQCCGCWVRCQRPKPAGPVQGQHTPFGYRLGAGPLRWNTVSTRPHCITYTHWRFVKRKAQWQQLTLGGWRVTQSTDTCLHRPSTPLRPFPPPKFPFSNTVMVFTGGDIALCAAEGRNTGNRVFHEDIAFMISPESWNHLPLDQNSSTQRAEKEFGVSGTLDGEAWSTIIC